MYFAVLLTRRILTELGLGKGHSEDGVRPAAHVIHPCRCGGPNKKNNVFCISNNFSTLFLSLVR